VGRGAAAWALALACVLSAPLPGQEIDSRWRLELGDPRFKHQTVDVAPGQIISMMSGRPVSFEAMIRDLTAVPFVNVGETHEALPTHEIQARIIRALWEQDRRLAVGLESVPAARQEPLTEWIAGALTEDEFLRQTGWYTNWGFNFGLYRPIFGFAREHGIPLYALDTPRTVEGQFEMTRDGQVLSGTQEPAASEPDPAEKESRALTAKSLESMVLPAALKGAVLERMFEDLYQARADRQKDMAERAVKARELEGRRVVVVIGSGHLMFGIGLDRFVRSLSGQPTSSVVPVIVPKGRPSVTVTRSLADYIVGVPAEDRPAYPTLGLAFKASPDDPSRLVVASKPRDGSALGGDFEEGDVVLSVDGRSFSDVDSLLIHLSKVPWGREVHFRLRRAGVEKTVVLKINEVPLA
jgi:uncharacterized iron-regulated protein